VISRKEEKVQMSEFDKLANDLGTLVKSQASDDGIAAAAEEAGVDPDNYDNSEEGSEEGVAAVSEGADGDDVAAADADGDDKEKEEEDEEDMGKSMYAVDANGEEVAVFDATAFLKSLDSRLSDLESGSLAGSDSDPALVKSMSLVVDMLKGQDARISALTTKLEKVAASGTGRRTVVTTTENLTKSEGSEAIAVTSQDLMLKAETALEGGKIVASDISLIESCINNNSPVPSGLMTKIGFTGGK
jgi:hypothetical protein